MVKFFKWLFGLSRPVRWLVSVTLLSIIVLLAITVSATAWEYTNSPEFCGTMCHTMPPEYIAYQRSPHARVDCVDCHLGQDSVLLTIPRKARELRHVVNALTQSYEPPIYVKSLRPARDTCEKCHNPDKFSSDTFVELNRYAEDEQNSETRIFLIVKTGGGTERQGLGRGIHWHIENEVWFYAGDKLKQDIPYVREVGSDGEVTEYFDVEAGLPTSFAEQLDDEQLHRMDCIDCHTRISHLFRSPSDAMDNALGRQQIDNDIPFIKEQGVELLNQEYNTPEEGLAEIDQLEGWYQENYPDYYANNTATVQNAVAEIKDIFNATVFPNMNVGWETHPNNAGHKQFPGCFRCHDGKHTSAENETIRLECNICHSIPEVVEPGTQAPLISIDKPNEPESHLDSNWLARHRYEFDLTCAECHTISNPGGTDDSSFCANSGCHATEWQFVGLDAPAIRAIVEPPTVPGSGEPQEVPHPIDPDAACVRCHGPEAVRPYPEDHAGYEQELCLLCHQPTLPEEASAVEVPAIPHLIDDQSDRCLECHGLEGLSPFPENHTEWPLDSCLECHQLQETDETAEAESSGRPSIPHTLEGREDCLFCHQLDSIKPFPADHEDRELEDCQICHKPAE